MSYWEDIANYAERLKVFGGWLVRTRYFSSDDYAMAFVPDANHEWQL